MLVLRPAPPAEGLQGAGIVALRVHGRCPSPASPPAIAKLSNTTAVAPACAQQPPIRSSTWILLQPQVRARPKRAAASRAGTPPPPAAARLPAEQWPTRLSCKK